MFNPNANIHGSPPLYVQKLLFTTRQLSTLSVRLQKHWCHVTTLLLHSGWLF